MTQSNYAFYDNFTYSETNIHNVYNTGWHVEIVFLERGPWRLGGSRVGGWSRRVGQAGRFCPYFYEDNGSTVIVNSACYLTMILIFLMLAFEAMAPEDVWLQHSVGFNGLFERNLEDLNWPAHSPDRAPWFFL